MRHIATRRKELRAKGLMLNEAELTAQIFFQRNGIEAVRRGYPDFMLLKNGEIAGFIEVKPRPSKALRDSQVRFQRFCERFSIPFMKWTPDDGEQAISTFFSHL